MSSHSRIALGLGLLLTLLTSAAAFAKGNFSFITIQGMDVRDPVRLTDPALTTDWFAFADFTRGGVQAPADPGAAYEITRYYVDAGREQAFDQLHYYPATGFVYFDGLVGGSSEYDGKWYPARPGIQVALQNALAGARGVSSAAPDQKLQGSQKDAGSTQSIAALAVAAGLALIFVLAFRFRKPASPG